jgi:hypothetical protein
MDNNTMMNPQPEGNGPLVGIVIIVLVLLIGGIYLVTSQKQDGDVNIDDLATTTEQMSTSTSYEDIEADLEATTFNSLDADLNALEEEIDQ